MSQNERTGIDNIQLNTANLHREENYTDLTVGSIQVLVPVTPDGQDDPSRPKKFVGQTQIMSAAGPLPINAPMESATTLAEAIEEFPAAAKAAVERLMEEAREMQRQEASRIVMPGSEKPGGGLVIP